MLEPNSDHRLTNYGLARRRICLDPPTGELVVRLIVAQDERTVAQMATATAAGIDTREALNTAVRMFVERCRWLGTFAREEHTPLTAGTAGTPGWWNKIDTQMTCLARAVTDGLTEDGLPPIEVVLSPKPTFTKESVDGELIGMKTEARRLLAAARRLRCPQTAEKIRVEALESRLDWAMDAHGHFMRGDPKPEPAASKP